MNLEFFVSMKLPTVTHQQKKAAVINGKPIFYEPPELKDARQKFAAHLSRFVPESKFTGPVQLITKWCYPLEGKRRNGQYKITRPDTDNMIKLLKDVMTELGFWKDDSIVASEVTEKFWAERPGIYVCIKSLPEVAI